MAKVLSSTNELVARPLVSFPPPSCRVAVEEWPTRPGTVIVPLT